MFLNHTWCVRWGMECPGKTDGKSMKRMKVACKGKGERGEHNEFAPNRLSAACSTGAQNASASKWTMGRGTYHSFAFRIFASGFQ